MRNMNNTTLALKNSELFHVRLGVDVIRMAAVAAATMDLARKPRSSCNTVVRFIYIFCCIPSARCGQKCIL